MAPPSAEQIRGSRRATGSPTRSTTTCARTRGPDMLSAIRQVEDDLALGDHVAGLLL
jgi:hypothetical protein